MAKLAKKVDNTTIPAQYSGILLNQGATSAEDDFIEVHIYGSMTIRTIEEIKFNPVPATLSKRDKNSEKRTDRRHQREGEKIRGKSKLMNAVISGQTRTALLIDGDALVSFNLDAPEILQPRRESDFRFLFGEATDLRFIENTRKR